MTSGNGEHITRRELATEIKSLRWEMRAYMLGLVLLVLFKLQVPQTTATAFYHLF